MAEPSAPSSVAAVEVRRLRSAIDFALLIVGEARKTRPALKYPAELDRFAKLARVPNGSLATVRRIIDENPDFRQRVGSVASADLVDDIGRLWLQRPQGWEAALVAAAAAAAEDEAALDLEAQLKRAEKRKLAAERSAARHAADLAARDQRIEELERRLDAERRRITELTAELETAATDATSAKLAERHARDKMLAAQARLAEIEQVRPSPVEPSDRSANGSDQVGDGPVEPDPGVAAGVAPDLVAEMAGELAALAGRLQELAAIETGPGERDVDDDSPLERSQPPDRRRQRRLSMPPGVLSDSLAGARFVLESGAEVLIDGYNVSKLAWPGLPLIAQRDRLIDRVEQLALRLRADMTIVFDGSDVVGAHSPRRRHVRVVYSATDELADDLIRAEVERLPLERPVVVVTNDREVVADSEAMGANAVSSDLFLELLG